MNGINGTYDSSSLVQVVAGDDSELAGSDESLGVVDSRTLKTTNCVIQVLARFNMQDEDIPCKRTTIGTLSFKLFAASMMPWAIVSHLMIPPKMLTRMA